MILPYVLLALAGFGAGYVNTIAGAGSLLTLPALIFLGLDAGTANATNRIAVLAQSVAAIATFRSGGAKDEALGWELALPATCAALAGAWTATVLSDKTLRIAIAISMLVFLALSFVRPKKEDSKGREPRSPRSRTLMWVAFLGIGFYAGFLQAGVGILILLYLTLVQGTTLIQANVTKVVVVLVLTMGALVVFLLRGQAVDWTAGAVLSVATAAGAFLGAQAALKRGERFIRAVLLLTVGASAIKVLWDAL